MSNYDKISIIISDEKFDEMSKKISSSDDIKTIDNEILKLQSKFLELIKDIPGAKELFLELEFITNSRSLDGYYAYYIEGYFDGRTKAFRNALESELKKENK